jgi:hypothetical protein
MPRAGKSRLTLQRLDFGRPDAVSCHPLANAKSTKAASAFIVRQNVF